jgi:hypothetical protein
MSGRTGLRFSVFAAPVSAQRFFLSALKDIGRRDVFYQAQGIVTFSGDLSPYFEIERFISLRDNVSTKPPEHVTGDIKNAFVEGAACLSIECYNAAATMFRLCVDLVTLPLLANCDDKTKPNRPIP